MTTTLYGQLQHMYIEESINFEDFVWKIKYFLLFQNIFHFPLHKFVL
jgi:hypothetical protein